MALPQSLQNRLSLPAISAPMFLVSGPGLVTEVCKNGMIGSFPSVNARPASAFEQWVDQIEADLAAYDAANPDQPAAPYAVNLIVHKSNPRFPEDLEICIKKKVPLIITSVGHPGEVVKRVHDYGGLVFHDVTTLHHARKAAEAGVDGIILVCAGAGGHAGVQSPFALVPQVREFWDGTLILAGAISDGRAVRAAQVLGADLAYMGTRFIATKEAQADPAFKEMIVEAEAADLIYTDAFSGVHGNFLKPSIVRAGFDPDHLASKAGADLSALAGSDDKKAWKDVWSAGQGVGSIHDQPSVAELIGRLKSEYEEARA